MKRILIFSFLTIFAARASFAQTTYTEKRQVSGFDEVTFAVSGEVLISLGRDFSVELEGDRDYIREIITKVDDDELIIRRNKWFDSGNKKVIVRITMPVLDGISVLGSGRLTVIDPLRGMSWMWPSVAAARHFSVMWHSGKWSATYPGQAVSISPGTAPSGNLKSQFQVRATMWG